MFILSIRFVCTKSVSKSHRKKHITLFNVVTISECLVEKQKYIYSLQALTSSIRCNLSNCNRSHTATWYGLNMKTYWVSQVVNCSGKFEEIPYLILREREDCRRLHTGVRLDWIFKLLSGESLTCHWCHPHKHDYTWPTDFISLKWFLTQYQAKRNQAPFIAFTLYLCWTPQVFVHQRAKQSRLVYYWDLTGCRVRTKRRNAGTRTENSKLMSPQEHLCTRTILDRSWKDQSDILYQTHSCFAEGWENTNIQL